MTLRNQYLVGLLQKGWKVNQAARSTKFTELTHADSPRKIYLGRGGAVRTGDTVAGSLPVSASFKHKLIHGETPK